LKKNVCIVTGSRAEFGLLKRLIKKINSSKDMDLFLVVTGMHLCDEFGYTCSEIEKEGLPIDQKIEIQLSSDTKTGMTISMGLGVISFANYFKNKRPDVLIVLGDRYEIFSSVIAAAFTQIPIAHLHGGETISGVIDEFIRHSITKMSILHFVTCDEYRNRVIQLGENPETVYNVGAMGIENVLNTDLLTIEELENDLNFSLKDSYAVITFHPLTMEHNTAANQVKELMNAIDEFPEMNYIITKSNADAQGREINNLWKNYCTNKKNCIFIDSLGSKRYLSLLKESKMMIGNSSSGIFEGPAMRIPTVNIGNRQKGRIMADSIICCETKKNDIIIAMRKALTPQFKESASKVINLFGDGNTSDKIINILQEKLFKENITTDKIFYDLNNTDIHL